MFEGGRGAVAPVLWRRRMASVAFVALLGNAGCSAGVVSETPGKVPAAPTALSALLSGTTATLSWTAPADNGGAAIIGYLITPYVGSVADPVLSAGNVTSFDVVG